jgi:hypothetical protein
VKHYYGASVELAVIELDIQALLEERFLEESYRLLLDPVDMFI